MSEEPSHSLWPSRLIVLVTGVAVGFFLWRTYLADVPRQYPPTLAHGQWLVAADDAPQGYFRHELYIAGPVQQAWVMVSATDSFILYLNGKAVDGKGYASLNAAGIYDIGHYLSPGKNVVGVVARRLSYPGPAMAVLEGSYRDQVGREHVLATDATWKFSPLEQTQGHGEIPWYAEGFDATAWQPAKAATGLNRPAIYPLGVHPLVFAMPPQGKWIGQADFALGQATFSYTLTLPEKAEDAWMRIASGKPYVLAINGMVIEGEETPRDDETMSLLRFQGAPLWSNQGELSTDLYRIAPLLHAGANRISVASGQRFPALPGLYVDGFVTYHGEVRPFGSDATWTVTAPSLLPTPVPSHHAIILTHATPEYGALPVKKAMTVILPLSYRARQLLSLAPVLPLAAALIYLLWVGSSRTLHALGRGTPVEAGRIDALAHLPMALILGSLYLLSFDVRFDPALPFQSWIIGLSVAVLLLCKATVLLEACYYRQRSRLAGPSASPRPEAVGRICTVILLSALVAAGAFFRLRNLDTQSLYHDEVHMVTYVQGLLEKGYPHKMIGPIERPLATYELAPYPIALSVLLLGLNDFALRLPAAVFGILTIPLIYFVGQQVFDRRVGLLAAAVYTFCPQAVIWAQYLWHPQQTQFFALLTSYLFYRAIRCTRISPRYLYPAAAAFIATYLSWEGSGFLLPALGLGVAVVKGKDLSWLRDKHLWIAVGLVSLAVALELIRRLLLQIQYLVIGYGLSDVSMPTLYFLDPMYDPMFYIKNLLWLDNNVILTLLALGTLPLLWRQSGFAYYCTLLFSVIFLMTNTLSNAAIRYAYYLQPFLILAASNAAFGIVDHAVSMIPRGLFHASRSLKYMVTVSLFVVVTLSSSMFMKFFRLSGFAYPSGVHTRTGVYYIDYRSSAQYVKSHYQDGDLVIALVADALAYYADIESQYFVQTYTMRQVFYDPSESSPHYLERIVGNPVLRDIEDLKGVLSNYRRIWLIAVPESIFTRMAGPEIRKFLQRESKVVYEGYNARVYLLQM